MRRKVIECGVEAENKQKGSRMSMFKCGVMLIFWHSVQGADGRIMAES